MREPVLDQRAVQSNEDPVCAMLVDRAAAAASGLTLEIDGRVYLFCSTGCQRPFGADPAWFLDPAYRPMPMA
ncbi:hypothetical protein BH20CHL7_BH20CHL7_12580 [soil metagenome]